jgi:hypothetical protein
MKIILSVAMGLLTGCASESAHWRESVLLHSRNVSEQARVIIVDPKDGISEVEAYKIGTDRFETYSISCGMTAMPKDFGERWRVTTLVGIAGEPFEQIWIRKSDGFVTIERVR